MSSTNETTFDYLFLGLGAANCLLLLQMHENALLQNKKIAIVDPSTKDVNDRTFCFWTTVPELEKLKLQDLVSASWNNVRVNGMEEQSIAPSNYYHIKGLDLYNKIKGILKNYNANFYTTSLTQTPVAHPHYFEIELPVVTLRAAQVYDSRPPLFSLPAKNESHLLQSFIGWEITTTNTAFDTSSMVMMDFEIPQNDYCQFMYVLPFTPNSALFEVTRFGAEKLEKQDAEIILKNYLQDLGLSYTIEQEEQGVIPMSSAKIENEDYGQNWVYTGARANLIKSTTGYAFLAMAKDAQKNVEAIQHKELYVREEGKKKFRFYDRLLLKILEETPEHGKKIFQALFTNVAVPDVLSFLSEKTSLKNEIRIFSKMPIRIFMKAAVKDLTYQVSKIPPPVLCFFFSIISLILYTQNLEKLLWTFLGLGFLTVGLSHGAVDHLTDKKIATRKQLPRFILKYILKAAVLGIVWYILPDFALLVFILYSAWHFGQADFKEWKLNQGIVSFLWGLSVLLMILVYHFQETVSVLKHIPGLRFVDTLELVTVNEILFYKIGITVFSLGVILYSKSKYMLLTLMYLLLSSMLPLLVAFGIYFVGQHSMHGWRHLTTALKTNSYQLWLKSLPYSISGALFIALFMFLYQKESMGIFFILLSCISIPHVISMHLFYRKKTMTG